MDSLRRFLAPPVFAGDLEKTRVASILNVVFLVVIGVALLVLLASFFILHFWMGLVVGVAPLLVGGLVAWRLLHAGYVYGVARFFMAFLWLLITATIIISGGVTSPETTGYLVVIAIAGMLGGVRSMAVFGGLSVGGIVAIYVLEIANKLPPPLLKLRPVSGMLMALLNLLVFSVIFYLLLSILSRLLDDARHSERTLADRNRELEAIRASLEDQVALRMQAMEMAHLDVERANAALQEQMWQVTGLAQLGDVMRGVEDVPVLAKAVLTHLCYYLEAQVGALYVADDDALVLVETYACGLDAAYSRRFALGEGLVGQVAAERLPHRIDGGDYPFTVVSSFGEIALAQMVLYPLLYGGTVVGVLELGQITPFTEAQERFLEQSTERLAVVFHTAKAHAQINTLLQETQQQAGELRAQEEELRAANEELSAQAESLRNRQ
ncbi:MAG: GAF domain-containing protein [Anaerolineae bacterium]|nr:GAF domain-containing protein [Anaerolineae bacterium]